MASSVTSLPQLTEGEVNYRSWSHLPKELLELISSKIPNFVDYLRFRSVCPSWRSAASPSSLPPQIPRLLLPYDPTSSARSLAGVLQRTTSAFDFPDARNKIVCGSGFGWLALTDAADASLSLFNPFTGAQVPLPPLSGIPFYHGPGVARLHDERRQRRNAGGFIDESENLTAWTSIRKGYPWRVFLSASPADDHCVVALTLSIAAEFAICKLGSEEWMVSSSVLPWPTQFVAFHKGVHFLFDDFTACVAIDLAKNRRVNLNPPGDSVKVERFYIVKTEMELLIVLCFHPYCRPLDDDGSGDEVKWVKVFEMEIAEEHMKWVEVPSIGGSAIFVSGTHSSIVQAIDFPGCREDCIYFSEVRGSCEENHQEGFYHFDVYDMKKNKYELIYVPWTPSSMEGLHCATWYTPNLG